MDNCVHQNERIEKYDERIEEFSHEEEYEKPVSKISCFKGIDTLSAMKIHVSVSDFQRFPTAKAFMANLGMLPWYYVKKKCQLNWEFLCFE